MNASAHDSLHATIHAASSNPPWPDTEEARQLRAWIEPFWAEGTDAFIPNVHTEMYVAICGDIALPLSVGSARGDSYVVSPTAHYVSYPVDEARHLSTPARLLSRVAAWPLGWLCRATRFDRVVMVNNWLLSTNLYPELDESTVLAILKAVRLRWQKHAVVFRSVDLGLRHALHALLTAAGARMMFARRVHIVREPEGVLVRSDNKKDAKLARKAGLRTCAIFHPERAAELYAMLYLEKYSMFNPQFSARLIAHAVSSGVFEPCAWQREGTELEDAVIGTWSFNGVITTPLLGTDTTRSRSEGLYRIACRGILDRAVKQKLIAHRSAGVAAFKQARGATSHLEYNAVFDDHLPAWRRLPWRMFEVLLNRVFVPMILKRNL